MNEHGFTSFPFSLISIFWTSNTKHPLKIYYVRALFPPKIIISLSVIWYAKLMYPGIQADLSMAGPVISYHTFFEIS
jgi:hypothetical protein